MLDTMMDTAVVADAVQLACRAPSLHNSQPWSWVADGDRLDLYLDRNRAVHSDQFGREAVISCGTVLDHLRVAMAAAGWQTTVERFPSPHNPDHLARLQFAPTGRVTDEHRQLADTILARRSDRLPFLAPTNWAAFETMLRSRFDDDVVRLQVLDDDMRPRLAEAAALTESMRLYDWAYHAELDWWTAPFEVWDGIPRSSLISAAESDRVEIARIFPVTPNSDRRPEVASDHAKILMLSTDEDSPRDALACGEVLSTVLLECAKVGFATCPITHLTELPASREILAALTGHSDLPQVLIRVGVTPTLDSVPPPTPRRPLDTVLQVRR